MKFFKKAIKVTIYAIFIAALLLGSVLWYYSDKEILVSPFFIGKARQFANYYLSVDFSLDRLRLQPSKSALKIENLKLAKYNKAAKLTPFLRVESLEVYITSQAQLLELFEAQVVVEKAKIKGLSYDLSAPLPDSESKRLEIPWIPLQTVELTQLELLSATASLKLSSLELLFTRTKDNGHLAIKLNEEEQALTANLTSEISLSEGTALINLNLKQDGISKFPEINPFLQKYGLALKDGNLELLLAYNGSLLDRINAPAKDIARLLNNELHGKLNISNLKADYKGIETTLNLSAAKTPTNNWQYTIKSAFAEGELAVTGGWLGRENALTDYTAKIKGNNIRLTKTQLGFLNAEPFSIAPGIISINGDLQGDVSHIKGTCSLIAKNTLLNQEPIKEIKLDLSLDKSLVLTSALNVTSDFLRAQATSTTSLKGDNAYGVKLAGTLSHLDSAFVARAFKQPVEGICQGIYSAEFSIKDLTSLEYQASLKVHEPNIYGVKPSLIEAHIKGKGNSWLISNPKAYFGPEGYVQLDGSISETGVNARVNATNIDIGLLGVDENIATGTLDFAGTLNGELLNPEIAVNLQAYSLNIMGIESCGLKSGIRIKDGKLVLAPVILSLCDKSMVDGFASMNLNTGALEAFNLNFQQFNLSRLRPVIPAQFEPETTDGIAAGSITYNNSQKQNMWNLYLEIIKPQLLGQAFDTLYFEGGVLGKQAEIRKLFVRGFGGSLGLSGQVINKNKFYGFLEGNSLKFERMAFLQRYLPNFSGLLDFQGNLEWDEQGKSGNFTVFSKNLRTEEQQLGNFGGNIVLDDEKLVIQEGEFDKLGLKLTGEMLWAGRKPYNAKLELSKVDFSFIPRAHGIESIDVGGLLVDGTCLINGYGDTPMPTVADMNIEHLSIRKDNNVLETTKPLQIIYQNETIEVRSFELGYQGGLLACEGLFKPGENLALLINGKNFSVEALTGLANLPEAGYKGDLSFDARLIGMLPDPKLYVNSTIENFEAVDRKISKIQLEAELDKTLVKIKEAKITLPNNFSTISGTMQLTEGFQPGAFDLKLRVPHGSIEDIAFYMPDIIKSASGTAQLDVALTGTPDQPVITGDCMVDAETIQLKDLRRPIKNLKMQVSTKDMHVNLDTFYFELGRGKVVGEGFVDFKDSTGTMALNLTGERLDIEYLTIDLDNADISVKIDGDIMNPRVSSNVYLPKSKFTLNTDLFMKSSEPMKLPFHSFTYDIRVDIPRNFWVKSSFLNSEFAGKFGVSGDLENFKLDGDIRCIQGKLHFKQRQFKIEIGEIKFGGVDNSFDPQIYIKSEGQIQSTKIFLTLTGRLSQFTPQIYSTPPMSEGDILALLTLGRELNSAGENDSSKQFETEIFEGLKNSYISSLVGSTLSEALNLDEVFLTSVFDKGTGKSQPYIRVGKYISERVFMAYEGTMDQNDKEVYIFEYRLPRGFIVNLEFTEPEQSQKIGVRYDWKFR
jgi:autotransporter translocation and assembly factor TamB